MNESSHILAGHFWKWLLCGLVIVGPISCESDEFANAPSAEAPAPSKSDSPQMRQQQTSGQRLPPNHPPIDNQQVQATRESEGRATPRDSSLPVDWDAPSNWESVTPDSRMRKAQYRIPNPDGEASATMAIYYFGPDKGGSIKANISRWVGQFSDKERKPRRKKRRLNSLTIHTVDVSGMYSPGMMGQNQSPKKDYRMIGIIAETPDAGSVFFKVTGPSNTIGNIKSEMDQFIKTLSPE